MKNVCFLLILFFFSSCVSEKNKNIQQNILTLKDSYCKAPLQYNYSQRIPSYNSDSIVAANPKLTKYFSDQSILILNALESIDDAERIMALKKDSTLKSQLQVVQLKTKINSKITIALTELDAVAAEFDCEGERVAQMADYVDNINSNRNDKLILFSIITSAVTSVAGGVIKNNGIENTVNIGGGLLGAGLGLATFNPKGKKVEFIHERNLLQDVWKQKLISQNFPPFVWYMYTERKFTGNREHSIIENMKQRWIRYQFDSDESKANLSVNFGKGGLYRSSDLHNRASMLNQMQSATRTINQNINYLLLDLDKAISD